jgi:uncharacterized protein YbjT (DUF2867 family)
MSNNEKVLVIGGTGRTGQQVVNKLIERGSAVRVLARSSYQTNGEQAGKVEYVRGDLTNTADVAKAMAGVNGVVIAVESGTSDYAANSPARVHYEGILNVIKACEGRSVQVVLVTQIYITRPNLYPEMANIIEWRGRGEAALRASGLLYTIVRPGWLSDATGGQSAIRFEQGDRGEGEVSREDVAEVCVQALAVPAARGKTFEIFNTAGEPLTDWNGMFSTLAKD